jgi:hypothetical protein
MWLVVLPFPVDILGMGKIDQRGSLHLILMPIGDMKGKIVIDEDAQPVALKLVVNKALVLAVTIR